MKNSKLTFKTLLILAVFISSINCTYAWTYTASGQWASFNFGSWTVYQNEWGSSAYCELYANSYSNWASAGSWTGGGTKGYPHVQGNPNLTIGSYWCNASFNFSGPSGATYTLVFDCWTTGMQDEIMIEEAWGGSKGHWGTQIASNVTLGGRVYESVWQAHNGANPVYIFTPSSQRTSGTTDIMAVFVWCQSRGLLHNNTLYEVSFGPEITSTSGWQQFTMNSFSASWGANNSGGSSGDVTIQNKATGLYVDGMGSTSNGSNAGQWSNSGSNAQKWTMETSGSNIKFKNVATGLYLDGMGSASNGSIAGQWSSSGSTNQQWTIETYGNYKRIKNVATGLYIDGMGSTSNGSSLAQWSNSGSDAQQWTITNLKSAEANSNEFSTFEEESSDIVLFPNPFTSEASLKINNPGQVTSIVVFDMLGKQVEVIDRTAVKNLQAIGSLLKPGMYVVKIYRTNKIQSFKITKK